MKEKNLVINNMKCNTLTNYLRIQSSMKTKKPILKVHTKSCNYVIVLSKKHLFISNQTNLLSAELNLITKNSMIPPQKKPDKDLNPV